jgi:hypothetical protein
MQAVEGKMASGVELPIARIPMSRQPIPASARAFSAATRAWSEVLTLFPDTDEIDDPLRRQLLGQPGPVGPRLDRLVRQEDPDDLVVGHDPAGNILPWQAFSGARNRHSHARRISLFDFLSMYRGSRSCDNPIIIIGERGIVK